LDGIRFLDVRLAPKGQQGKERLLAYHGITDERMEFRKVLEDCFSFLDGIGKDGAFFACSSIYQLMIPLIWLMLFPSSMLIPETIIMSLKQESGVQDTFINLLFQAYIDQSPTSPITQLSGRQRWYLEDRVPKLGEVRGKIIMLSRFVIADSFGLPGGISPPIWPNSFKGMWEAKPLSFSRSALLLTLPHWPRSSFRYNLRGSNQLVQTQDWYNIGSLSSIPEKIALIKQLCRDGGSSDQIFALNYCNGSSFPFALPPAVAKGFLDNGSASLEQRSTLVRLLGAEGVNSQVRAFIADTLFDNPQEKGVSRLGAIDPLQVLWAIDYYNEPKGASDLINLLIEANF
jgi:1-phosphatidylinositol phosphodiesterase